MPLANQLLPTNQVLTIGEVYQPSQGTDFVNLLNTKQNLEDARIRNRLNYMTMGQKEFEQQQQKAIVDAYGGPQAYATKMAEQNKALAEQELQTKAQTQLKTASDTLKSLKQAFGLENVVKNWDSIKGMHPMFKNMDPKNLTDDGYVVKDAEGKLIGRWVTNPEGGAPHFVPEPKEPVSTEANYRLGLEQKIKQEHPDWPQAKVQFEAAKQVREENKEAKKTEFTFKQDVKEEKEKSKEERVRARGFHGLEPEEKAVTFFDMALKNKDPKLAWGDRQGYNDLLKEFSRWKIDNFGDPGIKDKVRQDHPDWSEKQVEDRANMLQAQKISTRMALMQTDYRAADMSMKNQKKIFDMMNGFVLNLNKQVVEVTRLLDEADRFGLKLGNVPLIAIKNKITGSGLEASIKSYLLEISNEIGKLSTGSAASIRELGENAQIKWEKIHDTTLPLRELVKVLDTTRGQANLRIQSSQEAMEFTRNQIRAIGGEAQPPQPAPGSNFPAFNITRNPGETIPQFMERAKRGGK